MNKRKVSFFSEGTPIAGELYLPAGKQEKLPAVVLCHGFSGTKELLLPAYAEGLAESGYAVLAFDYRGFGESEGERGRLVPDEQMTDIRNAVTYMQTLGEVDPERIGFWGTSFGGANAIRVAAIDKRIRAITVQLTFASGRRMVTGNMDTEAVRKLEETLKKVRERAVTQNKVLRLNAGQILTDEESKAFFEKVTQQNPQLNVKIPFITLQHILEHNPEDCIAEVGCPVLIIAAENDGVCPPSESQMLFERAREPKKMLLLEGCRHYDAYAGEPFRKGIAEIRQWFSACM
ncbi:MAG: alpha/beta fold hydrolase [Thermodesulfovibrionales bacterium]|jgi:cephalosporin-C deacetylase-like acetyl esterase